MRGITVQRLRRANLQDAQDDEERGDQGEEVDGLRGMEHRIIEMRHTHIFLQMFVVLYLL